MMTMADYTESQKQFLCPKCGLHRRNALDNLIKGDPYAQYLLAGCPECIAWLKNRNSETPNHPIDSALAEILSIIQNRDLGPAQVNAAILGVLEALWEDGIEAGWEMER